MKQQVNISGWANYPVVEAVVAEPDNRADIQQYVLENERVIARGNGMSYGDASLGHTVISTLALRRILEFDPVNGIVECEAGVMLADLLPAMTEAGWFFHVTPGIKYITVGGAIASDVHGKNHPEKGCFSNWLLSFELMTADGQVLHCSREQNTALFWQTCGGMGWTGIILSARFRLMRISSVQMRQHTVRCQNMEAIFQAFQTHETSPYAAGWIDTTSSGSTFGRGAVHFAKHVEGYAPIRWQEKKIRDVPFFAPSWLLNPVSIRVHNALYFNKNDSGEKDVNLDAYFYPLDSLQHWNRLYGRRGFVQYQFCLPEKNAFDGIRQVMEMVRNSSDTPFLSVLKRHGERPPEAINSFPIKGYSLALDFPRTRTIFDLVKKLDALVWRFDGKIYLTKDACSAPEMGRVDTAAFPERKFWSALRERVSR